VCHADFLVRPGRRSENQSRAVSSGEVPPYAWRVDDDCPIHYPRRMGLIRRAWRASAHSQVGAWYSASVRSKFVRFSAVRSVPFAPAVIKGRHLAKPNYQYEKRQRDLAKKNKQEEKRRQKLAGKTVPEAGGDQSEAAPSGDGSTAESPNGGIPSEA